MKIKQSTSLPKFPSGDAWAKAWQKHWSKVGMPDGLDALDERFEAATWIQCQKIGPFPLILMGSKFWKGLREWGQFMIKEGVFATEEIGFGYVTDSPKEAVDPLVRSLPLGCANAIAASEMRTSIGATIIAMAHNQSIQNLPKDTVRHETGRSRLCLITFGHKI